MKASRIYLDHNATSPLADAALGRLIQLLDRWPANPGSVHQDGQHARSLLESSRKQVLSALGARNGTLVFTSGATEANNLLLLGRPGLGPVLYSALEHPSALAPLDELRARGSDLWAIPHDLHGRLDLAEVETRLAAFGADTGGPRPLLVVMAANNELGNLNPIAALGALAQRFGADLHVDAAQVAGRSAFAIPEGVTSITLSGHKAGAPVGVGALWLARGVRVTPRTVGGHQERGRRAGTENVWGAAALAAIFGAADDRWDRLAEVRDHFERAACAELGAVVNGDPEHRLPNTTNLSFPGRSFEGLLMALDLEGVSVSAGSACTAGSVEVSPVLEALGLPRDRLTSALRFSFGPGQTRSTADDVLRRLASVLAT